MKLTNVMYHYVREISVSSFPNIKGLEFKSFINQLDYLTSKYSIISYNDLLSSRKGIDLPKNSCLLTFDDGYLDHFKYVLPELEKRKIKGLFFPPVTTTLNVKILDVNKIHFILASVDNDEILVSLLKKLLLEFQIKEDYIKACSAKFAVPNRFDTANTIFFKRMLQHVLPEDLRNKICDIMFYKFVSKDQIDFSHNLYMSKNQLKELISLGHSVGSHTYDHPWLDKLSNDEQEKEIDKSLDFLFSLGIEKDGWCIAYPYGAFNLKTLEIIKQKGCAYGFTTVPNTVKVKTDNPLTFARLDTNDFPQ